MSQFPSFSEQSAESIQRRIFESNMTNKKYITNLIEYNLYQKLHGIFKSRHCKVSCKGQPV
jgi:hypothetical protein